MVGDTSDRMRAPQTCLATEGPAPVPRNARGRQVAWRRGCPRRHACRRLTCLPPRRVRFGPRACLRLVPSRPACCRAQQLGAAGESGCCRAVERRRPWPHCRAVRRARDSGPRQAFGACRLAERGRPPQQTSAPCAGRMRRLPSFLQGTNPPKFSATRPLASLQSMELAGCRWRFVCGLGPCLVIVRQCLDCLNAVDCQLGSYMAPGIAWPGGRLHCRVDPCLVISRQQLATTRRRSRCRPATFR